MDIFNKIKSFLGLNKEDKLEWDASSPAGDENAYDGYAVEYTPFDYRQFEEEGKVVNDD